MKKSYLLAAVLLIGGFLLAGQRLSLAQHGPDTPAQNNPEGAVAEGAGVLGHPGVHEKGPLIENWFSWDYGPGKTHKHPPFGFTIINFIVFLFILNKLGGKDLREFITARHVEVRKALDRARELEQKAQEQLRELEDRTRRADSEVQSLLAGFSQQAEAERKNIIARAEADAQKLLADAESQVQVALDSAKRELEQKAALLAVDLAEKLVVARITDADQRRLTDRYVAQVESLAGSAGKHGAAAPEGQV